MATGPGRRGTVRLRGRMLLISAPVTAELVNPDSGDFHELPGSPTLSAGLTDFNNGAVDLDGNPRTFNGQTDIGAYQLPRHTLTVTKTGTGAGTVLSSPSGIACGAMCAAPFPSGTSVTLSATPTFGSKFAGWTGCDSTSGSQCTVTIAADRGVSAIFDALVPPAPKIVRAKISSKHRRASFAFSDSGAETGFQCAMTKRAKKHHSQPKAVFRSCASPKLYKHLSAGRYIFEVRALSAGGSGPATSKKFKIT